MSYTILNIYHKSLTDLSVIKDDLSLADTPLHILRMHFINVNFVLKNDTTGMSGTTTLSNLEKRYGSEASLNQIIIDHPTANIIESPTVTLTETRLPAYDLWDTRYKVQSHTSGFDTIDHTRDNPDLFISSDDVDDHAFIHDECLVLVNGLVRKTSLSQYGVYVLDGAKSIKGMQLENAAIIELTGLGDNLKKINLTTDMLSDTNTRPLHKGIKLNVGESLHGKGVILVLNGYIHVYDGTYLTMDNNILDIRCCPELMRARFMDDYLNLDITKYALTPIQESIAYYSAEFYSNAFINSVINSANTFIITFDLNSKNQSVATTLKDVGDYGSIGSYITTTGASGLIRTPRGHLYSASTNVENETSIIRTSNALDKKYFYTQSDSKIITNATIESDMYVEQRPKLWNIIYQNMS